MKNVLLFLLFLLFSIFTYSQEVDSISTEESKSEMEHMKFMGTPIEGSMNEFKNKIISKGFRFESVNDNNITILSGMFAGHSAYVLLLPTRDNQIGCVEVLFTDNERKSFTSWNKISSLYFELKKNLVSKYGEPDECDEKFRKGPYLSDHSKMLALVNDNCVYKCNFNVIGKYICRSVISLAIEVPVGTIVLKISNDQTIRLTYADSQQFEMLQEDIKNDF